MALLAVGTIVAYDETDWEFEGRSGVARRLTISTGDGTEELTISDDFVNDPASGFDPRKLSQFGRPVKCRVSVRANAKQNGTAALRASVIGLEWVRLADLAVFGYAADFYVEDDDENAGLAVVS